MNSYFDYRLSVFKFNYIVAITLVKGVLITPCDLLTTYQKYATLISVSLITRKGGIAMNRRDFVLAALILGTAAILRILAAAPTTQESWDKHLPQSALTEEFSPLHYKGDLPERGCRWECAAWVVSADEYQRFANPQIVI